MLLISDNRPNGPLLDNHHDWPATGSLEIEENDYVIVQKGVDMYSTQDLWTDKLWTPVILDDTEVFSVANVVRSEKGPLLRVQLCFQDAQEYIPQLFMTWISGYKSFYIKLEDVAFYAETKEDAMVRFKKEFPLDYQKYKNISDEPHNYSGMVTAFNPYLLCS
ncbi:hypothetical protein N9E76_00795 [bacterium]|nr:hypothetical protein [bacterium]